MRLCGHFFIYGLGLEGFSGIFSPMPLHTTQGAKVETVSNDAWLKPRWFVTLLAVLMLASYPQIFLGFQTFVYRDFGIFSYPIAYHLRESLWHGEIPLWNPLNNCGVPFLAQWNTQVLYPPALFYLLFPLSWSLGVFCLLHLFWGGCGMFLLARRWTQNHLAAAFAGIVFTFNGRHAQQPGMAGDHCGFGLDAVGCVACRARVARRRQDTRHGGGCWRGANAIRRCGSSLVDVGVAWRVEPV